MTEGPEHSVEFLQVWILLWQEWTPAPHINFAMQCCANFLSAENIASSGAENRTGSGEKAKWPRNWERDGEHGNLALNGEFCRGFTGWRTYRLLIHFFQLHLFYYSCYRIVWHGKVARNCPLPTGVHCMRAGKNIPKAIIPIRTHSLAIHCICVDLSPALLVYRPLLLSE